MTKIFNTFKFTPAVGGEFGKTLELVEAPVRGAIKLEDGDFVVGEEIVEQIANNPDKIFLVSKFVFDHLVSIGCKNICMWDMDKTTYSNENGRATLQGGVIFAPQ